MSYGVSLRRDMLVMRMFARMFGRVPTGHLWYLFRQMRYQKPHRFAGQVRINTFFPPYPSLAFNRFCNAVIARRRVPYSVYLAVTGECPYECEHCSYAGRPRIRMPGDRLLEIIRQVKLLGTCTLGLTGGEPLLREDLEDLAGAAAPEMACVVFTTGRGLNRSRAVRLCRAGVTCVTIGLESADPGVHDRVRGSEGSFAEGCDAARCCTEAGIYLALSTIASRAKLQIGELEALYDLAARWEARELRVLAPVATGGWAGCNAEMLTADERLAVTRFQQRCNRLRDGPAVAAFTYLESDEVFGCGAGFHHLFIDAAGQVCPCDLTPLSFGDATKEPLADIWQRMARYFPAPRRGCLMSTLAARLSPGEALLPLSRECSEELCSACPSRGPLPEGYRRLVKRGCGFST